MAVVKEEIKVKIKALIKNNTETDPDKSIEFFAEEMSKIIVDAIRSASVTIPVGAIQVATAGTPSAQTGANTTLVKAIVS